MGSSSRSARDSRGALHSVAEAPAHSLVTVGRVVGVHGVRGEVRVRPETDFPQRFAGMRAAYLVQGGTVTPVVITDTRPHRGEVLMGLAGIASPQEAARLRGAAVAVTRDALVPLEPGQYYVFEVVGLRVRTVDGRALGTVAEVMRSPAHDVYLVRGGAGEVLVPAVREFVRRIDTSGGEMVVDLPPGLEEAGRAR